MNFEALVKTFSNSKSLESGNNKIIRHNAFSNDGQKAISLYDKAIAEMKARDNIPLQSSGKVDPTSWKYQAAIHGTFWLKMEQLKENTTQKGSFNFFNTKEELDKGDSIINNCTHFSGLWNKPIRNTLNPNNASETKESVITDITINFLPWHRLYLENFENIVRSVLKDLSKEEGSTVSLTDAETWALPYWEYTKEGQDTIPEGGFTNPSNKGLFEKSRSQAMQIKGKGLSDLKQPEKTVMLQYDLYKDLLNEKNLLAFSTFK